MELEKDTKISILKSLGEKKINKVQAQILLKNGLLGFVVLDEQTDSESHLEALIKFGINPFIILKMQ